MSSPRRRTTASCWWRWAGFASATGAIGCGGGFGTLHPVHPLPPAKVEVGAGTLTRLPVGRPADEIDDGRNAPASGTNPELNRRFIRGALQHASLGQGTTPWVSARVGIDGGSEGGITYTGRNLRLGVRHALAWDDFAISAGLGASSVLTHGRPPPVTDVSEDGLAGDGFEWSASGYALDLPLAFGWGRPDELLSAWMGARFGYEALSGTLPFVTGGREVDSDGSVSQWFVGGSLGVSVGVEPVWVRFETEATYHRGSGTVDLPWEDAPSERFDESFDGISLTPGIAVALRF